MIPLGSMERTPIHKEGSLGNGYLALRQGMQIIIRQLRRDSQLVRAVLNEPEAERMNKISAPRAFSLM